jgi:hypothetical protein
MPIIGAFVGNQAVSDVVRITSTGAANVSLWWLTTSSIANSVLRRAVTNKVTVLDIC